MSLVDPDTLIEDARAALLELARLLGRVAAEDALDPSTPDTSTAGVQFRRSPRAQSDDTAARRGVGRF